jgi:glycosyltransferase involved in cell wall biosynthesis
MESIVGSGGHEVEHDRQIIEELKTLGHEVVLYVPEGAPISFDYKVPVQYLPGKGVSYVGISGLKRKWLSAKREVNRLRWFKSLYRHAVEGKFDAILFPTSTYRFFRSLNHSMLRKSPVPVIFCVLGVTPQEGPHFFREAEKLVRHKNVKIAVMSLVNHILGRTLPNVHCVKPAIYVPRDIDSIPELKTSGKLKLGFFGQYRREKRVEDFLEAFTACNFKNDVELVLQTVAIKPDDVSALAAMKDKYRNHPQITFYNKAVYGKEWQQVIAGMDALIIPYAAERFRYHGSGMLLTAIGLNKPVVIADSVWPELFKEYHLGMTYSMGDKTALTHALESFVETYFGQRDQYAKELQRVNEDFSPRRMALDFIELARSESEKA